MLYYIIAVIKSFGIIICISNFIIAKKRIIVFLLTLCLICECRYKHNINNLTMILKDFKLLFYFYLFKFDLQFGAIVKFKIFMNLFIYFN